MSTWYCGKCRNEYAMKEELDDHNCIPYRTEKDLLEDILDKLLDIKRSLEEK